MGQVVTTEIAASIEARLAHTLQVVVAAFGLFAVLFVLGGRPIAGAIDGGVALAVAGVWHHARRVKTVEAYRRSAHLSILACVIGLTAASVMTGQELSNVPWFLVAVPLAAAYLISVRAAFGWAVVVLVVQVAVPLSQRWFPVTPEFVPGRAETIFDEMCTTVLILGLAVIWRRLTDRYGEQVAVKERDILAQAEALRQARDEALAAAVARERFVASVSHEIRTPLNGVIGMASLLLSAASISGSEREMVRAIDRSGKLLLGLVNDILDFSRLESGSIDLMPVSFSPAESVESVLALLLPNASSAIVFESDIDDAVPRYVLADRRRVEQVLLNLVGNAIKFTERGRIRVEVRAPAPDHLQFAVVDTGIGIPGDKLDRLFKPFSQVDASTTRRYGGTGLGLAISRRLVEAMGGEISVRTAEGEGSTFTFSVKAPVSAEPPPDDREDIADRQLAHRLPLRILVAEDNAVNRQVIDHALRSFGYHAHLVDNGRAAVDAAREGEYDVILMDLHMPEMDGLEASRQIRALALPRSPRIIGVTASVLSAEQVRMREAGFDDFVPKPVSLPDLVRALRGCAASPARVDAAAEEDADPLSQLKRLCAGRPGSFERLLAAFARTSSELLDRLEEAAAGRDARALEMAAHSLKSSSAQFGCTEVSAQAASIEAEARDGDMAAAVSRVAGIRRLLAEERGRLDLRDAGSGSPAASSV